MRKDLRILVLLALAGAVGGSFSQLRPLIASSPPLPVFPPFALLLGGSITLGAVAGLAGSFLAARDLAPLAIRAES